MEEADNVGMVQGAETFNFVAKLLLVALHIAWLLLFESVPADHLDGNHLLCLIIHPFPNLKNNLQVTKPGSKASHLTAFPTESKQKNREGHILARNISTSASIRAQKHTFAKDPSPKGSFLDVR